MKIFNFNKYSNNAALIDGDSAKIISYSELEKSTAQFISSFDTPKKLCFFFISPAIEDLIAYLALLNHGYAVALLAANLHPDFIKNLIKHYHPSYIIISSSYATSYIQEFDYKLIKTSLPSINVWQQSNPQLAPILHAKLQLLLSTSGTTGNPKLIRLSSQNILANAHSICQYLNITSHDRAIASLPFHYSFGLSILHTHLLSGASIVLTKHSLIQEQFWQVFSRFECTSLAGVPYTYQLLDRLGLDQIVCPSLNTLTQAGGKLSQSLVLKFHALIEKRQGRFFTMYGQTEATARIAYLPLEHLPAKAGGIGIAIPNGNLQLFDGKREIKEPFLVGELVYSGPNVMLGYAVNSTDLALGDMSQGVLSTGDIGYRDTDGIYYISGRIKRFSKIYGYRVNLDDVEKVANQFGQIIVTSDDFIIKLHYENDASIDESACVAFLASIYHFSISTFKCIKWERFPLTASGKIDYTKLQ